MFIIYFYGLFFDGKLTVKYRKKELMHIIHYFAATNNLYYSCFLSSFHPRNDSCLTLNVNRAFRDAQSCQS